MSVINRSKNKKEKIWKSFNKYIWNSSHPGYDFSGLRHGEKGWFDDKSRGLIAKMVTQIALPCYMLYTITQRFTAADLLKMLPELRFPALSMVILFGIATAVARIFAVRQDRRGLFISMFLILIRSSWDYQSTKLFLEMLVFPMF